MSREGCKTKALYYTKKEDEITPIRNLISEKILINSSQIYTIDAPRKSHRLALKRSKVEKHISDEPFSLNEEKLADNQLKVYPNNDHYVDESSIDEIKESKTDPKRDHPHADLFSQIFDMENYLKWQLEDPFLHDIILILQDKSNTGLHDLPKYYKQLWTANRLSLNEEGILVLDGKIIMVPELLRDKCCLYYHTTSRNTFTKSLWCCY